MALAVLAALMLAGLGVVVWNWVGDYLQYQRIVVAITHPGQRPTYSIEEFLQYRQAVALNEAAERLLEIQATAQEVRAALGEPRDVVVRPGEISWFYSEGNFRGYRLATIVIVFDSKTYRVQDIGHIKH